MADVIGPGNVGVSLARERVALQARQLGEFALEVGGGEGAEVAPDCALAFDNHQPLLLALELVDLNGFVEILGCVLQYRLCGVSKAAGEVFDGYVCAVDATVVAGEEEEHVFVVGNDCRINWAVRSASYAASEERISLTPAENEF